MSKAFWYAQNEDTDPPGCLLQGEAAFEPERRTLKEMGAPDTEFLIFHDVQPVDRDDAVCEAEATPAFIDWCIEQGILSEEGE
jgi:hypothetical protein